MEQAAGAEGAAVAVETTLLKVLEQPWQPHDEQTPRCGQRKETPRVVREVQNPTQKKLALVQVILKAEPFDGPIQIGVRELDACVARLCSLMSNVWWAESQMKTVGLMSHLGDRDLEMADFLGRRDTGADWSSECSRSEDRSMSAIADR